MDQDEIAAVRAEAAEALVGVRALGKVDTRFNVVADAVEQYGARLLQAMSGVFQPAAPEMLGPEDDHSVHQVPGVQGGAGDEDEVVAGVAGVGGSGDVDRGVS